MSYTCDAQNRLTEVAVVDGGNEQLIARYGYDPLNRRLCKEQYRERTGAVLTQAKRTYYLYADEGLPAEAEQPITLTDTGVTAGVTASTPPRITRQYGPKPDNPFTTGILFVKTKDSRGQDTVAYYHHDPLHTPVQATDKHGNVVWSATYDAFGKATVQTQPGTEGTATVESLLRLPGQIEDPETGLHYNFNRYYDPETGRYITQDPIGLAGGINRYAYANNSPLRYVDPTGQNYAIPLGITALYIMGIAVGALPNPLAPLRKRDDEGLIPMPVPVSIPKDKECNEECDPPEGTKCYDKADYGRPHAGLSPHYHIYQMQKIHSAGECYWRKLSGKVGVGVFSVLPAGMNSCLLYPSFTQR